MIVLCRPGTMRAPLSLLARVEYKMSLTRVDFPDPLTPVTATNAPRGIETSTFLRLFSLAPLITICRFVSMGRRLLGIAIERRPDR